MTPSGFGHPSLYPNGFLRLPPLTLLHDDLTSPPTGLAKQETHNVSVSPTVPQPMAAQNSGVVHSALDPTRSFNAQEATMGETKREDQGHSSSTVSLDKPTFNEPENSLTQEATQEFNTILRTIPLQLLFRRPLSTPSVEHVDDPWFERQQDAALNKIWEPKWQQDDDLCAVQSYLISMCSPTVVLNDLIKMRASQGVVKSQTFFTKEKESLILQTRSILEKYNIIRDVEELKGRQKNLMNMKLTLISRNPMLITGSKVYPFPQLLRFPTPVCVYPSNSQKYTCWSCVTFTLDDIRKAFEGFKPPLFYLSDTAVDTPRDCGYLSTSYFRVSTSVAEHLALALERRVKRVIAMLIKSLTTESNDAPKVITLDTIQQLLASGQLHEFPFDTAGAIDDLRFHRLEKRIKHAQHEDFSVQRTSYHRLPYTGIRPQGMSLDVSAESFNVD